MEQLYVWLMSFPCRINISLVLQISLAVSSTSRPLLNTNSSAALLARVYLWGDGWPQIMKGNIACTLINEQHFIGCYTGDLQITM